MTTKTKAALAGAAACLAIGAPAYLQQRQIRDLREEVAWLRAAAPPRKAVLTTRPAEAITLGPEPASPAAVAAAEPAGPGRPDRSGRPATGATRALGQGNSGLTGSFESSSRGPGGAELEEPLDTGLVRLAETGTIRFTGSGQALPLVNEKVQWDHAQATGAPDTEGAGDIPTAWAPKSPRSGEQWLQLGYANPVEIKEVNIHETHNPGAVSKVAALLPDGSERILWRGTASPPDAGEDSLETSLPVPAGTTASQIKVYVDTNRVQSWPEIDAVELIGTNGSRQWATSSNASSSYSENYSGSGLSDTGFAAPAIESLGGRGSAAR